MAGLNFDDLPAAAPTESKGLDFDALPADPAPLTGGQRQRAYLKSLREGEPTEAAGRAAPGPDTSAESLTAGELASQWGDVGKGLAKGVPASLSGGLAGDIESMPRQLGKELGVPQKTWIPTTVEGGYLGPRGLNWMDPAANPREAAGMMISSALVPGLKLRGKGFPEAPGVRPPGPSAPPVGPMVERPNLGVRLLPPEVPHAPAPAAAASPVEAATETLHQYGYPEDLVGGMDATVKIETADMLRQNYPEGPPGAFAPEGGSPAAVGRASVGAAATPGTGPLAGVSPLTLEKLKSAIRDEGFTPYTLDQRLEEMSQHEFLGELSDNTRALTTGLQTKPGPWLNEIKSSVRQRGVEAAQRMETTFDQTVAPKENLAQLRRSIEIDRDKESTAFWKQFRATRIAPTSEIEEVLPGLEAAGALRGANEILRIRRRPTTEGFEQMTSGEYVRANPHITTGGEPPPTVQVPTAEAFQYAKENLDTQIAKAITNEDGTRLRALTELKNDMIKAVDEHPDPSVAGVWKQARDVYAAPTSLISAMKMGKKALTNLIESEELPFLTSAYSDAERQAFRVGLRSYLHDHLGRPGKQELAVINKILAPGNVEKMQWALGEENTATLVNAIEHEQRMHHAPTNLIHQSATAGRLKAAEFWEPPKGLLADVGLEDVVGAAHKPVRTALKRGAVEVMARRGKKLEGEYDRMRAEAAPILTLQGPERDAVVRQLFDMIQNEGKAHGGRIVVARKKGGRVWVGEEKKLTHQAVGYLDKSKTKNTCAKCSMFVPAGSSCTLVRSPIAPGGWCRRFAARKK